MSFVFVVDTNKKPLNPVHPGEARYLLSVGKAAVLKRYPFTIILKKGVIPFQGMTRSVEAVASFPAGIRVEHPRIQPLRVKLDPGSRTTGIALVDDATGKVLFAAELIHRGQAIRDALLSRRAIRRGRRARHTRYRKPRFDNRTRPQGWIAPSLQSRVYNVLTWVKRLMRICPIEAISMELVRFDMQAMEQPDILECLKALGLPVECGSGGRTKFNRTMRNLPKTHWLDACCVGKSTPEILHTQGIRPFLITATGHGRRQMCVPDKYGFPKQHKQRRQSFLGYRTGDIVKAVTSKITVTGRIAIRHRPSFRIGKSDIHPKYMRRVHRADGYRYEKGVVALPPHV